MEVRFEVTYADQSPGFATVETSLNGQKRRLGVVATPWTSDPVSASAGTRIELVAVVGEDRSDQTNFQCSVLVAAGNFQQETTAGVAEPTCSIRRDGWKG